MSAPGWYPDPAGTSGAVRYWNGQAWTQQSHIPPQATRSSRPWGWFILAMVVIAGLVAVFVLRPLGPSISSGDTNSARPTGSQWNELPITETPTQPQEPGGGSIIDCPQNSLDDRSVVSRDGRMHGGGLSFEAPKSSDWRKYPVFMPWLYDHNSTTREIVFGWQSNLSVGEVLRAEGFPDPRTTASQLMGCLASSDLYRGFSGRDDLLNEPFTLDGNTGWRITADVLVDSQGDIKGDVVDVIVLDLGDPDTFAVYISCATIENEKNLAEVARAADSLSVD